MTKNRTPTPVYLDPGMHPGLEVKGLTQSTRCIHQHRFNVSPSAAQENMITAKLKYSDPSIKVISQRFIICAIKLTD